MQAVTRDKVMTTSLMRISFQKSNVGSLLALALVNPL